MRVLSVICFVFIVVAPSIINGQPKPLERPVEFILLLDGSTSLGQDKFNKLVDLVRKWPDHFVISEKDSRVAVVQFGDTARIELPLTGDESKVRNLDVNYMYEGTGTHKGLRMVKEEVLSTARNDAIKAVIIITDGESTNPPAAKAAADELREAGCVTYALFIGEKYKIPKIRRHIEEDLAADPKRAYHYDDFDKMADQFIKEFRENIVCTYDELCQFNGPTKCENVWIRRMDSQNGTCSNDPPDQFTKTCGAAECTQQCDKWKWEEPACDGNEGKNVKVKRAGSMPMDHKGVFEKCPPEKEVTCPTVPPTSAASTSVTAISTESEASGETGASGSDKSTVPSAITPVITSGATSDGNTIDGTTTIGSAINETTIGTMIIGTSTSVATNQSTVPDGAVKANTDEDGAAGGFATWIIVVIVVVIICILIAIIVVAVVVSRRKKRAKEAKEKADQKKAGKGGKSKGGGSLNMEVSGFGVPYNRSGDTADHNLGVSMLDPQMSMRKGGGSSSLNKSTSAGKNVPKSKDPPSKPKESMSKSAVKKTSVAKSKPAVKKSKR